MQPQYVLCIRLVTPVCIVDAAPTADGADEAAAEGEPAVESAPAAEDGEEADGEAGPPKPDYSKNILEYVVAGSGQVHIAVPCSMAHVHCLSYMLQIVAVFQVMLDFFLYMASVGMSPESCSHITPPLQQRL